MIDLVKTFSKHEKAIADYILSRKSGYKNSSAFKSLKSRYFRLRDSIDLRQNVGRARSGAPKNSFQSKIVFPLVREQYNARKAVTKAAFKNDPLVTMFPSGDTPIENATNMTDVLNLNWKNTFFRRNTFNSIINMASACGVGLGYTTWHSELQRRPKTVKTQFGIERQILTTRKKNALTTSLNPLNYMQNHNIVEPGLSDWQGHLERVKLSTIIAESKQNEANYIKNNLEKVIKEAKESALKDKDYYDPTRSDPDDIPNDWASFGVDRLHYWGVINIRGNEDDLTEYYVQMVGEKIVRFQTNPYDDWVRPYSVYRFDRRPDYWWGNVDVELQMPFEQYFNLVFGMKADNAIRNLEQYIFYDKTMIDTADINNRHKSGGWIPVDLKQKRLQDIIFGYQGRDVSNSDLDMISREMKEASQRMATPVDLQRPAADGGLQNKTLGAAQMAQTQGAIKQTDYLDEFSNGLSMTAEVSTILLQQYLGDQFGIRPDIKEPERILGKEDVLGRFNYQPETSLNKNDAGEAFRLQNAITAMINFSNSGNPIFQQINMASVVKEWIRKLDLPGDIDDIMQAPEEQQQMLPPQPQAIPGGMPQVA